MKIVAEKPATRAARATSRKTSAHDFPSNGHYSISTFRTSMGWMGLLGLDDDLVSVFVGHMSANSVSAAADRFCSSASKSDWNPAVRDMLQAYADGEVVDFSRVEIRLPDMTPFRQMILSATRQVRYGETTTYGQLAKRIGHPGAARAVGTAMSTNRFPILIPCHRVLAAGGRLGGYTSPSGIELKRRMLMMEDQHGSISLNNAPPKWILD